MAREMAGNCLPACGEERQAEIAAVYSPETRGKCERSDSAMGKRDSLFHGTAANLSASLVAVAAGFVTSVVLARAVGPEGKGRYDLINATITLAASMFGLSLDSGINYWVAKGAIHVRRESIRLAGIAVLQGAAAGLVVAWVAETSWCKAILPLEYRSWAPWAVAVGTAALLLTNYGASVLTGLHRFVLNATLTTAVRLLVAVTVVTFVFASLAHGSEDPARAAILAVIAASCIGAIIIQRYAWVQPSPSTSSAGLRDVALYAAPCYVGNLAQFLNYRVDVFFVAYFLTDTGQLALYTTAVSLAQLLWLPAQALQGVLLPNLTSLEDGEIRSARAAKATRTLLVLIGLMGLSMAVLGPALVLFLFGPKFSGSIPCLWLLLPGIVIFGIARTLACHLGAIGKPRLNLVGALAGLAVTLGLNLVLIPLIGIAGAAITSSVSYITTALVTLWFFSRESGCSYRDALLLCPGEWREMVLAVRQRLRRSES